jgi:hypothetical protein
MVLVWGNTMERMDGTYELTASSLRLEAAVVAAALFGMA